jgi:hypothetical protein
MVRYVGPSLIIPLEYQQSSKVRQSAYNNPCDINNHRLSVGDRRIIDFSRYQKASVSLLPATICIEVMLRKQKEMGEKADRQLVLLFKVDMCMWLGMRLLGIPYWTIIQPQ